MNIAEKMKELLASLRGGLNGVSFPEIAPDREASWGDHYAALCRIYVDDDWENEYFDSEKFWSDFMDKCMSYFPGAVLYDWQTKNTQGQIVFNFMKRCQELEVYRVIKKD